MRTRSNLLVLVAWLAFQDFRQDHLQGLTFANPVLQSLSSLGNGTVRLKLTATKNVSERSIDLVLETILNVSDLYEIVGVIEKGNRSRLNFSFETDLQQPPIRRDYGIDLGKVIYEDGDQSISSEEEEEEDGPTMGLDDEEIILPVHDDRTRRDGYLEESKRRKRIVLLMNDLRTRPVVLQTLMRRDQMVPKKTLRNFLERLRSYAGECENRESEKNALRLIMKNGLRRMIVEHHFPKFWNVLRVRLDVDTLLRMLKFIKNGDQEPDVERSSPIETDIKLSNLKSFQGYLDSGTVGHVQTESYDGFDKHEDEDEISTRFGSDGHWNVKVDTEDKSKNLSEEPNQSNDNSKLLSRNLMEKKKRKPNSRYSIETSEISINPEVFVKKAATDDILKSTKRHRKTRKTSKSKSTEKTSTTSVLQYPRVVDKHVSDNVTNIAYPNLPDDSPIKVSTNNLKKTNLKHENERGSNVSTTTKIEQDSSETTKTTLKGLVKIGRRRMKNLPMPIWRSLSNDTRTFKAVDEDLVRKRAAADLTLLKKILVNPRSRNWRTQHPLNCDSSSRKPIKLIPKKFAMDDILEAIDLVLPPKRKERSICSKIAFQGVALNGNVTFS